MASLGVIPEALRKLYAVSNGLVAESVRVRPIETSADAHGTWDGLARANDPARTGLPARNPELLRRFLVFAVVSGDAPVAFDRGDESIWYQDGAELHQTSLSLAEFIQDSVREG